MSVSNNAGVAEISNTKLYIIVQYMLDMTEYDIIVAGMGQV